MPQGSGHVLALCGGIGGAKLALGLSRAVAPDQLTILVNTGDDFVHLGLAISPDIDTVLYTLSGLADPVRGWGVRDETWNFMAALGGLGGETWFQLGDRDLATHVERTRRLAAGESLAAVTEGFRRAWGIGPRVLPMSDDPVRTRVETAAGWLDFQDYFVRRRCEPAVTGLDFAGAEAADPSDAALTLLASPELRAVVICPSNPYLSIDPLLAMPGLRRALAACPAPVVVVSPIVGGAAVKGPTAKMMGELGIEVSVASVARHYEGLIDALVVDAADRDQHVPPGLDVVVTQTVMRTLEDRVNLAKAVLAAADRIGGSRRRSE
ncbi:2-phospho-L-lactate transferase [Chelatococcus reniformis]|uniref:LPPG--FO 2-phospho-L-lactate transferase n=1 Tax=Chelatococcus reniformis TaxID=1494448 RepID=A0A916XMI6_9HYPH|nr:2-phospho-L-lactate transferase [Chelatococcus reniformis]GGC86924.1 LPPG--FO 2-phospho-L-lactate transferase [Chelatococcus reniformis]